MTTKKIPPVHPGEILRHDFMEPAGLNRGGLAKMIGVSPARIGQILSGQRAITVDTALGLARFFGTRPKWWLDLQSYYDRETGGDNSLKFEG